MSVVSGIGSTRRSPSALVVGLLVACGSPAPVSVAPPPADEQEPTQAEAEPAKDEAVAEPYAAEEGEPLPYGSDFPAIPDGAVQYGGGVWELRNPDTSEGLKAYVLVSTSGHQEYWWMKGTASAAAVPNPAYGNKPYGVPNPLSTPVCNFNPVPDDTYHRWDHAVTAPVSNTSTYWSDVDNDTNDMTLPTYDVDQADTQLEGALWEIYRTGSDPKEILGYVDVYSATGEIWWVLGDPTKEDPHLIRLGGSLTFARVHGSIQGNPLGDYKTLQAGRYYKWKHDVTAPTVSCTKPPPP